MENRLQGFSTEYSDETGRWFETWKKLIRNEEQHMTGSKIVKHA